MIPGIVLVNAIHQITAKEQARKLLVILSDGEQHPFIAVTTTSQSNQARGTQAGCQIKDRFPSFYLPLHATYLKEATWIQLDQFVDLNPIKLAHTFNKSELVKVCRLPKKILKELLVCIMSSKDISKDQEQELWKTLVNIDTYYQKNS
jgi:hypothetical protein